ncbi:MAG: MFS transporter [Candidatus Lokiarchaeota archaeon]|nr:MFS transporter [Candidatus Lokiarchaeota archaeon]MBD3338221.1 MFS transporter [Candidatus Lokiarchaeota archaeon]
MTENNDKKVTRSKGYFRYMIFILIFVQILDAYTTSYTAAFPSKIIEEFLSEYSANEANSIMALSVGIATVGMYFVFVNQYLADKFGRKLMLFVTTLGMGASALLLALSTSIIQYTIFLFMTYLFFSSDMWLIYVNEEAEPKKRALYTNILMAGGIMGPILMPIFRSIFITETSPVGAWRGMTLFPIFLGIPLAIVIILTFKETSKYEEMKKGQLEESEVQTSILLKDNIKALFTTARRKEIIVLYVISYLLGLNFILLQLGESFIASAPNMRESQVNIIILIIALSVIIGYLLTGVIADKIGRIPLLYACSILLPLSTLILFYGVTTSGGIFIIVVLGIAMGYVAYDSLHIVLRIIIMEVVPTDRRGTGSGLRALITAIGITSGFLIGSLITLFFGLGVAFIVMSIPLLANIFLIRAFVKETKGTDLGMVK